MNAKALLLCWALALAPAVAAREKSDILAMRNGDRLTCEIRSLDSDVLYVKGASTSTRNELDLSAQQLLRWNNWYYTGLADFLQSTQQGISRQSTFSGGIGRYLRNSGCISFAVAGGAGWQRIDYQETSLPSRSQQVTSALIASQLNVYYFDRTNLSMDASVLPALSTGPHPRQPYYVLLRQTLEEFNLECHFLGKLGQPAAAWFFESRLRR